MRFWIIYILFQISLLATALGRFGQCFLNFLLSANHGGLNLYSAPHHKKASYGPVMANFWKPVSFFLGDS